MPRPKQFNEEAVLEQAQLLFWKKGFNGVGTDELFAHLPISRSSLYNAYTDKRGIFMEALKYYCCKNQALNNTLLETDRRSVTAILKEQVKALLDDETYNGCFAVNTHTELATLDKKIEAILADNYKKVIDFYTRLMENGQQQGVITKKLSPKHLAEYWLNGLVGLHVSKRGRRSKAVLKSIGDTLLNFIKK
jgi:TetR/AcrR family transcriptional regulator, transcriptional repressor for nem operon